MASRKLIGDAILRGVQHANRQFEARTRGLWVTDAGAEGHMVSTIAGQVNRLIGRQGSIETEVPFGDILDWSGARRLRGRPPFTMNPRHRADIAILADDWEPVCVIEVKRFWEEEGCLWDLVRVRDLILRCGRRRNGSMRMGFLTFLLDGWEEERCTAEHCLIRRRREVGRAIRRRFDMNGVKLEFRMSKIRGYPREYQDLHDVSRSVHAAVCIGLWGG